MIRALILLLVAAFTFILAPVLVTGWAIVLLWVAGLVLGLYSISVLEKVT